MLIRPIAFVAAIMVLPAGVFTNFSSGAPESWEYWEFHNAENAQPIDHSAWDEILETYIRPDGAGLNLFAYGSVTDADKAALKAYIASLTEIEITERAKPVQLAYWLNLYNALTIDVVLDHYPVASIRDIRLGGLLSRGPWDGDLIEVEGEPMSLNAIEHEILRPIWQDPRLHYGINCASIGCPNLHDKAFTGANVDGLLDVLAKAYLSHPRGITIEDDTVVVSSIFEWFAYDFGNSEEGVINHISQYITPEQKAALTSIGEIDDTEYDWALNE